jgi:hypothetical protein
MIKLLGKNIVNGNGKSFSINLDFILGLLIMLILGLGTWGLTRVVSMSESLAMKASKEEVACEIRDLGKEIKNDFKELRHEVQIDIRSLIKEVTELTRKVDAIYGYNKDIE